jgi:hypothetical protein
MKTPEVMGATPGSGNETPSRDYLGWLASIMPGRTSKEDVDWRPIEADRLEERRLEELSQEVYGY